MRNLFLLGLLSLIACQQESTSQVEKIDFNLPQFTRVVINNMDNRRADVIKSFTLNGQSEEIVFQATDSLFWSKELEWLKRTDLMAPKYQGVLSVSEGAKDNNSNLLVNRFSATDQDIDLRDLEVFYLDEISQVRLIRLKFGTSNFIADSEGQITVWLNKYGDQLLIDSLIASGKDKVLFQDERNYETRLRRIRQ